MQRSQNPRIDLAELKVHIVKKIGVERTRRYFYYLGRFLSQKLTKSQFDKSCYHLLGRENLALHNKLIHSILRNASCAKSPPLVHKTIHPDNSLVLGVGDGPPQSRSLIPEHNRNDPVWSNGAIRDRLTPLEPLCKEDKSGNRNTDKGDLVPFAYQSSGRYPDERGVTFLCPAEKLRIPDKSQSLALVNRADEAQEERGRLIAPLGIPFCSASVGGARRTVPVSTIADFISCYDSGGLSDTEMLRKRMESIAVAHSLEGVSAECSSMLNSMLDVYLKKLIKSCVNLSGARSMNGTSGKQSLDKLQSRNEIVNGSNSFRIQSSNQQLDITQQQYPVSFLDFRVAMELNPCQFGEEWPLLWERTSMPSFKDREGV